MQSSNILTGTESYPCLHSPWVPSSWSLPTRENLGTYNFPSTSLPFALLDTAANWNLFSLLSSPSIVKKHIFTRGSRNPVTRTGYPPLPAWHLSSELLPCYRRKWWWQKNIPFHFVHWRVQDKRYHHVGSVRPVTDVRLGFTWTGRLKSETDVCVRRKNVANWPKKKEPIRFEDSSLRRTRA